MNQFAVLFLHLYIIKQDKVVNLNETVIVEMIELEEKVDNYDVYRYYKKNELKVTETELYLHS